MNETSDIILWDYWRSSASYRVRIALNILCLPYRSRPVDLLAHAHLDAGHLAVNPQGFVPALSIDGRILTQSLAIIEYLDETRGRRLLPADPVARHRVRCISHAIAMDIHPVCNVSVVGRVAVLARDGEAVRAGWMQHFIGRGLAAVERMLDATDGPFCHGGVPTMADACLIPQIYNARRWNVALDDLPRIREVEAACALLDPFRDAHPDRIGPPAR